MTRAGSPAGVGSPGRALVGVPTLRTDRWWRSPLITMLGLLAFIIYATWAAFVGKNYFFEPYISPFYSPCLAASCTSSGAPSLGIFGTWWPLSPALIILIFPLGFRLTCYYYRKAYYRSFGRSPAACGVPEPHQKYTGETRFPLILQNIHRYFFFAGLVFNVILTYDAIIAFRNHDGQWFHAGVGTVVLVINAVLLWLYSMSCHSCRHLVGGRLRHFSKHPVRYWAWTKVSILNERHMLFAWLSLGFVAFTDLYVRLVASGTITDLKLF